MALHLQNHMGWNKLPELMKGSHWASWKEQGIFPCKICRLLLPHSPTAALLLCAIGDIPTLLRSCPIPFPGSPPGSVVPSPLPHRSALLGASHVCPHSTSLTLSRTSSVQFCTKRNNREKGFPTEAAVMGHNDIPADNATLLGTFPPVQSKAKWAHLGFGCVTMTSEYQETT